MNAGELASIGRRAALVLGLSSAVLLAIRPAEVFGQIPVGAHLVHANDAFGGATGIGVRGGLALPALPFDVLLSGEHFFPDCPVGQDGCSLSGITLEANVRWVIPVIRPYATGGFAWRDYSLGDEGDGESVAGLAAGAGVDVSLGNLRAFGEARYEFLKAPERQFVWRLGVMIDLL